MSIPLRYLDLSAMSPMRVSKLTLERLIFPCKQWKLQVCLRHPSLEWLVDIRNTKTKLLYKRINVRNELSGASPVPTFSRDIVDFLGPVRWRFYQHFMPHYDWVGSFGFRHWWVSIFITWMGDRGPVFAVWFQFENQKTDRTLEDPITLFVVCK